MKNSVLIMLSCLALSCQGQNQEFAKYLSNFRSLELPLTIDRRYSSTRFYQNGTYKEITQPFIKKFICKDSVPCDAKPSEYRYDYGIKFTFGNYQAILINKQKYEGYADCDFDLAELILVIYSLQGEIISEQSVGKNNDCWLSSTQVTNEHIQVQQIKLLEFNKPEMSCEIETKVYKIAQNGVIDNLDIKPIKKGIVIWDEKIEDFRLK